MRLHETDTLRASATTQADVCVVGAGIAGLVTTLELLDHNHSVVLVDRCQPDEIGGLAREAFGGMFMVDTPEQRLTGIRDNFSLAWGDWQATAEFDAYDNWPRAWAQAYIHTARDEVGAWLKRHGVRFLPAVNWAERGLYGDGNSVPRFHLTWGCGKRLVDCLLESIESHSNRRRLEIRLRHRVTELLRTNGAVTGCAGINESSGQDFVVDAPAVVIAAGGIGGNLDRVKSEWPRDLGEPPAQLLQGSHEYADGYMHDVAKALGANVTNLDRMWNYPDGVHHPHPRRPLHGIKLIPPRSGLWLNYRGRRLGPIPAVSGYDTRYNLERVCAQAKKYSWQVLNWKIAVRELDVSGAEHNPPIRDRKLGSFLSSVLFGKPETVRHFVDECEDFVTARSVRELAASMNELTDSHDVDSELLEEQIRNYDQQIARGRRFYNDDQLRRIAQLRRYTGDRLRTCSFRQILDESALPLIAIRLNILSRKSLGGIQTDLSCRVLQADGQPVNGLYAAGEAAGFGGGGLHGKRSLEGTFLGACVLTGRVAARSIAGTSPLTTQTADAVPTRS